MFGNHYTIICQYISTLNVTMHNFKVTVDIMSNREIYNNWILIQDLIRDSKLWPTSIRKLFWTKNIKYFNRFRICCFAYVKGLHPDILCHWPLLLGLCRDSSAMQHLRSLQHMTKVHQKGKKFIVIK